MRKKIKRLFLLFLIFSSVLFSSCKKENQIDVKFVYRKSSNIYFGNNCFSIPAGYDFAFDEIQSKGWLYKADDKSAEFILVNTNGQKEDSFVIEFENNQGISGWPFLVSDNVAIIPKYNKQRYECFMVNIETKEIKTLNIEKIKHLIICDFYDNKIFAYINLKNEKEYGVYDCSTEEYTEIKTDLNEFGFLPLKNAFVGQNNKKKICIQDFNSNKVLNTYVHGLDNKSFGEIRDNYYITDKYLYFAKKDKAYCVKYFFPRLLASFTSLSTSSIPHVWYRYSFENGQIEKIKTDYPFITILGIIEE